MNKLGDITPISQFQQLPLNVAATVAKDLILFWSQLVDIVWD
ncbi:MAG TPA: hypothetical protein V6C90_26530 [Coleofasciculaceae cyanobacterium]